jgi:hypothetical protein
MTPYGCKKCEIWPNLFLETDKVIVEVYENPDKLQSLSKIENLLKISLQTFIKH